MTNWTPAATLVQVTDPYPEPTPPPYSPQTVYVVPQQPPKSGLAVASLVFAVIGLLTFICTLGVPSAIAVILGHAARADTKRGTKTGDSNAKAGLIIGYIVLIPMILFFIMEAAGVKP